MSAGEGGADVGSISDKLLTQIIHNLQSFPNETVDLTRPHLRPSLSRVYPLYIFLYSLLVVCGMAGNAAMIAHILRRRLHRNPTNAYLMNIAVCQFVMSFPLLPLSLAILLLQNWIFGSFLCYFVPMIQDAPIHATMVTLVVVSVDRYRRIVYPHKARLPPFIAVLGVWITSVCVVLPYAIYMNYIDLQVLFGNQFKGAGICTVNLGDDIAEYIRGLFIILYVLPLAVIGFVQVRVSAELGRREGPLTLAVLDRSTSRGSPSDLWTTPQSPRPSSSAILTELPEGHEGLLFPDAHQLPSFLAPSPGCHTPSLVRGRADSIFQLEGTEAEAVLERRTQRYLASMVTAFALCLCPLMILRLVKNMVMETYENSGHFDITFITFVWLAFLPTVTTPALYAAWRMSRSTKERIRSYLHMGWRGRGSRHAQNFTPMLYSCHPRLSTDPPSSVPAASPSHRHLHSQSSDHPSSPRPTTPLSASPLPPRPDHPRPYSLALPT